MTRDHELAHRLAAETAEKLLTVQQRGLDDGIRGWSLELEGDSAAHKFLVAELERERPDDGLLSEEGSDDGRRTSFRRAWIVDPLDGSSGFGVGNAEWAVHVAMAIDGEPLVGAVAVPGMGMVASTLETPTVPERGDRQPIVVTGRSRARQDGIAVAAALDASLTACSSAGVKAMLVMDGQADVYVHDGPLYEWDACAPVAVAVASGLDAVTTRGQPLRFNQDRPVIESLLICRPEFTQQVVAALG